MRRLDAIDLDARLSRREAEDRLAAAQRRLLELRLQCSGLTGERRVGPPVLVLLEGWDASGKGGAIRRMLAPLDPRHVHVATFGPPSEHERRQHFLQRFMAHLPGWGEFALHDRSWYGRVLVERVEGYANDEEWQRAYGEIVAFERLLAAEGMVIVKLWMHISAQEQLDRFLRRERDPLKRWKLTEDDWRNRERRPQYEEAVEDMLARTDHAAAPWHLVAAEHKPTARVTVIETVNAATEAALAR